MTIQEAINHTKEVAERNRKCNENKECVDITCEKCAEEHEQLVEWLEELQQYRAIGTVKECREARERQRAKKPIDEYIHCISKVHQGNCPVCGNHVYADLCNITPMKYCQYCGQAIDWSDTD